ncbi:MAG TPA: hypothetical protein VJ978_03715, partial [Nitriliruptoraceae bacterium]|nr:hypothetical protein [Nitriliruptoraceae bacterium]
GSAAMRRSRLDDWLRYQKEFWYYVTVGAWGPLPTQPPEPPGSAAMRRSRLDDWLRYQKEFWYYVTVGAWGPLPTQPPEPPS